MSKMNFVSLLALVLGLSACGTASMDLGYDDASVSSDAGSTDSAPAADTYTTPDNGQSADAGQQYVQVQCGASCTVAGNQGVCSSGTIVCQNSTWSCVAQKPTTEACNGLDDNCNGTVDEGCATQPPTDGDNWVRVDYPFAAQRTITVELSTVQEPNGPYWKPEWTTGSSGTYVLSHFNADYAQLAGKTVYLYVNVDYGNPPTAWLCDFNRSPTSPLDPNATFQLKLFGKLYSGSSLSWAKSLQGGCSGVVKADL